MISIVDQKRRFSDRSNHRASTNAPQRQSFARLLKSAVVMNWTELIAAGKSGVVQVDCRFGEDDEVVHLTVWVATERGEWRHAGEYSMSKRARKSPNGVSFDSGAACEKLAGTLDAILEHQASFVPLRNQGRDGLIEVEQPTTRERRMAETLIASTLGALQDR